ncbi:hypothetical protein QUE93_07210 [Leuconostoc falkenbergense]|uniref:Uncharacterized protein n=1 Tax=Leuconostoc falkenbergense TaxID=2766470 RepID=A0ABT7RZR1_9LACO|nr:hypothetical protein [Leuconostoc falkenbergense]MDM7646802.1 hypothetical protein [Leuconostoc falkenbergense]
MWVRVSKKLFEEWKENGNIFNDGKYGMNGYYYLGHPDSNIIVKDYEQKKEEIDEDNSSDLINLGDFGKGHTPHLHILQFTEEGKTGSKYQIEFKDFNEDISVETISKYTAEKSLEVGKPLVYLRHIV